MKARLGHPPTPNPSGRVVIVGAGLAGVRVARHLHNLGHTGEVIIVGAEESEPYDRPPLSKDVLNGRKTIESARLLLDGEKASWRLRLGEQAVAIEGRSIVTDAGNRVSFDQLVIATGSLPRRLPEPTGTRQPDAGRIHYLRTDHDALRLRRRIATGGSLLIVGGGFIGAEVATTALAHGCAVTMLEAADAPCAAVLGREVGVALGQLYRSAGMKLHTGVSARTVYDQPGQPVRVDLPDESVLEADDVVVGIGSIPCSSWLPGSPDDGVECDANGLARSLSDHVKAPVYAVGDVARWPNPWGEHRRHEHWTTAAEQARTVAAAIVGAPPATPGAPYFWSDQFGIKLQFTGWLHRATRSVAHKGPRDRLVMLYVDAQDQMVGVLTVSDPATSARARQVVSSHPRLSEMQAELRVTSVDEVSMFGTSQV